MASHATPWRSARPREASALSRRRPARIRAIAAIGGLGVIALVLATIVPLFWSSHLLGETAELLAHDSQRAQIAGRLELSLDTYSRISNLAALTPTPAYAAARRELADEMRELLRRAPSYAGNEAERATVDDISHEVNAYLAERERLDASGISLDAVVRGITPYFARTNAALERWRRASEAEVLATHHRAERVHRISHITASVAAGCLVLLVIVVVVGMRRYVVVPTLDLHGVITKLRSGDTEVRAAEYGPLELSELAHALNQLIDALVRQRNGELAFLAGVAHDLRNPLAALKMGVHVLGERDPELRHDRTLGMIDRQVDRLARMVEELFDATQVAAGHVKVERRPFDLRDVAREVAHLYDLSSPVHEVVLHLDPSPVMVDGDAARVEQVINNLVSNAIKFSPNGGRVDVRVEQSPSAAVLAVTDHGIGIAPEQNPQSLHALPAAGAGDRAGRRARALRGAAYRERAPRHDRGRERAGRGLHLPRRAAAPATGGRPSKPVGAR